jgi:hypothetical protein
MGKRKIDGIDFEEATDIFVGIFPGASLAEVLEHAERAERNLSAWGKAHETEVMGRVISTIRRRLSH